MLESTPGGILSTPASIQLTPGVENHLASLPRYEAEGCLLVFQSATHTHSLQYGSSAGGASAGYSGVQMMPNGTGEPSVSFNLQALVLVDPKFHPVGNPRAALTTAVDENGTSLLLPGADQSTSPYSDGQTRGLFLSTSFNLSYPTNTGMKLARLEGSLRFPAVIKEETWVISDVLNAKPESRDLGGRSVTIESIRQAGLNSGSAAPAIGPLFPMSPPVPVRAPSAAISRSIASSYEVRITEGTSTGGEAPGLRRTPNALYQLAQSLVLVAADGTQLSRRSSGGGGNGTTVVSFYAPDTNTVPSKLIWKVPVDTRELVVPFTVTDLPIP